MGPTEELMTEHAAIRTMLSVVYRIADEIDKGNVPPVGTLERIMEFFRVFADTCHHAKEEEHLFPALEHAGIPREHGPVGVMLSEHTAGRRYIKLMQDAVSQYRSTGTLPVQFSQLARAYCGLLDSHIEKENTVLFPLAAQRLGHAEQEQLTAAFARLEEEKIGAGKHEEFHHLLKELKAQYAP